MVVTAAASADHTGPVVVLSLVLGAIAFLAGGYMLIIEWRVQQQLNKAAKNASRDIMTPPADVSDSPIKAQGGIDSAVNAIANLAKAIKDLDRSGRLLIISLAFLAIAAAAAIGGAAAG
jgi:disulfide bond formation protein DsbB